MTQRLERVQAADYSAAILQICGEFSKDCQFAGP